MEVLQSILDWITGSSGTVITIGAVLAEVASRLWPTKNPGSIIRKIVVGGGRVVVDILEAIINIIDKVFPDKQKT